jgi:hypothetical protein
MEIAHVMHRPRIRVTFGTPIPTAELPIAKAATFALTHQLEIAIDKLKSTANVALSAV